jgi:hypothetical protein
MDRDQRQSSAIFGLILILVGLFFVARQLAPDLFADWLTWPLIIMAAGGFALLGAIVTRSAGLAVPGTVVTGIGSILYWQNATGRWDSWSYIWTLIPGFVGLGLVFSSLLGAGSEERRSGLQLMLFSLVGFAIFGGAFEFGWDFGRLWPLILILIGGYTLLRGLMRR